MKQFRISSLLAVCFLGVSAHHVMAQTAGSITPLQPEITGNTLRAGTAEQKARYPRYLYSISASAGLFDVGGQYNGPAGTQSVLGGLAEFGIGMVDHKMVGIPEYTDATKKKIKLDASGKPVMHQVDRFGGLYTLGGWYWGKSGSDFWEVHGRYVSPSGLGIQIGYLNSIEGFIAKPSTVKSNQVSTDAEGYDAFVIYQFSSYSLHTDRSVNAKNPLKPGTTEINYDYAHNHNWAIELGGGIYIDASRHETGSTGAFSNQATGNYTFFAGAAYQVAPRWWIQASDWALRIRRQDLNRLSVGISYKFDSYDNDRSASKSKSASKGNTPEKTDKNEAGTPELPEINTNASTKPLP